MGLLSGTSHTSCSRTVLLCHVFGVQRLVHMVCGLVRVNKNATFAVKSMVSLSDRNQDSALLSRLESYNSRNCISDGRARVSRKWGILKYLDSSE